MTDAECIGQVSDNGVPATMCANQFDFFICDGAFIYRRKMTEEDGSTEMLTALDLPLQPGVDPTISIRPTHIDVIAQRLVCNSAYNSNQWFFSELPDANGLTTFAASCFYSAEANADVISALTTSKGNIVILGTRSQEIWSTQNNRLSPYTSVGGTSTGIGTEAPYSVAKSGDYTFFLGSSDTGSAGIFMTEGTTTTRISNNAIEDTIMSFGIAEQRLAIGSAYTWTGDTNYILDFPSVGRTFVWSSQAACFHERLSIDIPSGDWKSYRYRHPVYHLGKIWMGISDGPGMIYLDPDTFTEHDGQYIKRQLITSIQWNNLAEIQGRQLTVDCETGTTKLLTGQGSDPQLLLETSRDGGYQYGTIDAKSVGTQGNYNKVVRWGPRGMSRKFAFRLTFCDNCSLTLYQGRFDYSLCGRN